MKKRAELTEQRPILEQQIKQIDSDVAAIDQIAGLFDQSILPKQFQERARPLPEVHSPDDALTEVGTTNDPGRGVTKEMGRLNLYSF